MQRASTTSLAFLHEGVETKPPFGANVVSIMKSPGGSAQFPNLPIDVSELDSINGQLLAAIAQARGGSHEAVAHKLNLEKDWDQKFKATAKYVGSVANGNEEIIRAGGFVPTKSETTPSQAPEMPANFKATVGAKGAAAVESNGSAQALGYVFVAKTAGANVEVADGKIVVTIGEERVYITADSHKSVVLNGMQSHIPVEICMMAFNRAGSSPATQWQEVTPQ